MSALSSPGDAAGGRINQAKGGSMNRHEYVATREDSLLLIIDLQQAMRKVMASWEKTVASVRQLTQAANTLGVPVLVTEQYKKGLGATDPEVLREINSPVVVQKEHFSACLEPAFLSAVHSFQRNQIVVAGMETHVCVLQTCLDLIASGFQVHLAADAVASRVSQNRDIAVDLLRQAGAVVSSAEIVIFQWACRANTADFRRILPIVK
jgi:nicotinamidase-related amidase